ncbi:hypothetical protein GOBAR_AA33810 [Gossypium barbadense]|uniref:Uncharacterized protein n=1 Tax=Gossypium barbadense TaxID=3634 RepID=A0A2P5W740_GOSBA|nr:hypothetical protein GOBAR_AA33810 [Gossypium barbadense]
MKPPHELDERVVVAESVGPRAVGSRCSGLLLKVGPEVFGKALLGALVETGRCTRPRATPVYSEGEPVFFEFLQFRSCLAAIPCPSVRVPRPCIVVHGLMARACRSPVSKKENRALPLYVLAIEVIHGNVLLLL